MSQITRRTFLRRATVGAGSLALMFTGVPFATAAGPTNFTLRIAHTNDHHARVEETTNITIGSLPGPPATTITRNLGGLARRKTLFDGIRADAATRGQAFLALDAGDVFQGTLYFNQYGGIADAALYRLIGYDAITLGNHEFNRGPEGLAPFIRALTQGGTVSGIEMPGTNIEVISANITTTPTSPINGLIKPNIVRDFGGRRVGIFGLTTPETVELSSPGPTVTFGNVVDAARAQVTALQAAGCNIIIALTHLGYLNDIALAQQVDGIDVIVGGHSHTPLRPVGDTRPIGQASAGPYPTLQATPNGNPCLIVTAWEWGKWAGDITLPFDADGILNTAEVVAQLLPVWAGGITGNPPRALLPGEGAEIAPNADVLNRINTQFKPAVDTLSRGLVGNISTLLNGARVSIRNQQTNLGTLIGEAMLRKAQPFSGGLPIVALMNGGGIRESIQPGWVSVGEIITVLPFGNTLGRADITGAQLRASLEGGLSQINLASPTDSGGRFPQVAGLRLTFDATRPAGSRITELVYTGPTIPGVIQTNTSVSDTQVFRLITNSFLLGGGDGYTILRDLPAAQKQDLAFDLAQVVNEYLSATSNTISIPVLLQNERATR